MVVRFLMDENQKKEDEILTRINRITSKANYPDSHTAHLAVFLKSCFDIELEKKLVVLRREEAAADLIRNRRIAEVKRRDEERRIRELEAMAPSAPGMPAPQMDPYVNEPVSKREYALKLYGYPIGVLIDRDQEGRWDYKKFEPVLDPQIVEFIEVNFGEIIGKNFSILDKKDFIDMVAKKVSKKLKMKIDEHDYPKILYYLKRDAMGGGLIDSLLYDDRVREITIAGTDEVIIKYGSHGRIATNIKFKTNEQLDNLIYRIARATGQGINEQQPIMQVQFQEFIINATLGVGGSNSRIVLTRV
jgi:hypothetical protein